MGGSPNLAHYASWWNPWGLRLMMPLSNVPHTAGSRREVEKQSGWEDDEYRRVGDCSDKRLPLTSCESGIHPKFTRPLNSPPLPSPERCDLIRAFRSRGRAPRALRAAEASSVIICNRCTVPRALLLQKSHQCSKGYLHNQNITRNISTPTMHKLSSTITA